MCKEFKGDCQMAEDLSANVKDTNGLKRAASSSFSFSFYIAKVLAVASLLMVFLGVLGCFKLRQSGSKL
uniref:Putative ovule protein n=1 Tax=Solanum chacoense TaxID=4108 RepID=A0A0V0H002_SOLCH